MHHTMSLPTMICYLAVIRCCTALKRLWKTTYRLILMLLNLFRVVLFFWTFQDERALFIHQKYVEMKFVDPSVVLVNATGRRPWPRVDLLESRPLVAWWPWALQAPSKELLLYWRSCENNGGTMYICLCFWPMHEAIYENFLWTI